MLGGSNGQNESLIKNVEEYKILKINKKTFMHSNKTVRVGTMHMNNE